MVGFSPGGGVFVRSKVSLTGDRYARGGPAHDSELSFRFLVIARVSAFIGLTAWRDVVFLLAGRNRVFLFSVTPRGARLCFSFPVWARSSGRLGWRIRWLLLAADPGEFSPPLFYFFPRAVRIAGVSPRWLGCFRCARCVGFSFRVLGSLARSSCDLVDGAPPPPPGGGAVLGFRVAFSAPSPFLGGPSHCPKRAVRIRVH